jgi:hypothetical protein
MGNFTEGNKGNEEKQTVSGGPPPLPSLASVTPAMADGSDRLKSIDDENCPFDI